jgi:hypothetical protein
VVDVAAEDTAARVRQAAAIAEPSGADTHPRDPQHDRDLDRRHHHVGIDVVAADVRAISRGLDRHRRVIDA